VNVLTHRGLLIRIGVSGCLLVGVILSGCSGRASERDRLQGDTYLHLGKYDEAVTAYLSAIESDNENAHAKLGLGRGLAALGDDEGALASFREAVNVAPDFDLGYLELVNTLFLLGRTEEAFAEASAFEEIDPTLGGVLQASLMRRAGDLSKATTLLKSLQTENPESPVVQTHLASTLLAAGNASGAEAVLQPSSATSTGANVLVADVLGAQGRARELVSRIEEIHEPNTNETLVLAHALIRDGRLEEGQSLIRSTLEKNPSSAWANYLRGAYLLEQGKVADAAPLLKAAAINLPWEPLIMNSREPPSSTVSASVSTTDSNLANAPTSKSDAIDLDWQQLWQKASLRGLVAGREQLLKRNEPGYAETLALSACLLDDLDLAQSLVNELPQQSPMRDYLSALAQKDARKAIDALDVWKDGEGRDQVLAMNATAYAMRLAGARNSAVQVLSNCYRRHPGNSVSLFNLANVFREAGMTEFAAHTLRRLIANAPDNLEAHLHLFQVLNESGSDIEARQVAEVMYALFPGSREAVMAASGIYVNSGFISVARRVVESFLESHADDAEINLALAAILFREDRVDDALAVLAEIDPGELAVSYTTLTALSHAAKRDWQTVFKMAGQTSTETMPLATRLIQVAAHIETARKSDGSRFLMPTENDEPVGGPIGAIILNALGDRSVELSESQRRLAEALASNDRALSDFASGLAFQEARLHDAAFVSFRRIESLLNLENDYLLGLLFSSLPYVTRLDAKEESLAIAEKYPENPRAWLGHASIVGKAGDQIARRTALDRALAAGPEDSLVIMQRGDFYSDQGDYDAAIAEYRRLLAIEPANPVANNNLAYNLLLTGGGAAEALGAAERAMIAFPNDAHVLHTLGVAQLRAGQLDTSKQNLAKALERRPGDPDLLLDYGQLLIERGEVQEGIRYIQSALNTTQSLDLVFNRKEEAEKILETHSAL